MTDADLDFTRTRKPSLEQARFVWNSMAAPSCRKVAAELKKRGAKISFKAISIWHNNEWKSKKQPSVNKEKRDKIKALPPTQRAVAKMGSIDAALGGPLTQEEINLLEKKIGELAKENEPQLVARFRKARLIYGIVLLEQAALRADLMILEAKDASSLMNTATEAVDQLKGEPDPDNRPLNGNGETIDVTPNEPNRLSASIAAFKRRQDAA